MKKVNFHANKNVINLSFNGQLYTLTPNDKRFGEVRELIKDGDEDGLVNLLTRKEQKLEEYIDGSGLMLRNGDLVDSDGEMLPSVLSIRLQELKEDGMPVNYLVSFWKNLKENPSLRSREQLFKFLEQKGHPLTEDGCFIAYRGVTKDFKDKHTKTFDNSPGSVCEMPRRDVDDDPNQTCSRGLHVAAYEYARDFSSTVVEVKVNPRDVVAVPTDYNGQKMRVCRFEVIQVCPGPRENEAVYEHPTTQTENNWDDTFYEDECSYDSVDVGFVLQWAMEHKDRYNDRNTLALRIQEDAELELKDILEILNDNESEWQG